MENDTIGELQRVCFPLTTSRRQHERLREKLRTASAIDAVMTYRDLEED
jgi:hypothetical protein